MLTPFPDLDELLTDFVHEIQTILQNDFVGAYLQGSLSGEHPDRHGDVDFVVVIERPLTSTQLSALQAFHPRFYAREGYWPKHMEGSYFPKDVLRRYARKHEPFWYLDNGSTELVRDKHDDTIVVRWVLRERGIVLAGPDPKTLIDSIETADLKAEVKQTMVEWGEALLADPTQFKNGWRQQFVVLSYCRMLQTLQTGRVESKLSGAQWGQMMLDEKWHGLIQRSWEARANQYTKVQKLAPEQDARLTAAFVRYALTRLSIWL